MHWRDESLVSRAKALYD